MRRVLQRIFRLIAVFYRFFKKIYIFFNNANINNIKPKKSNINILKVIITL